MKEQTDPAGSRDQRQDPKQNTVPAPRGLAASLIGVRNESSASAYFADRKAHRFNAVWVNLLCDDYTFCNSNGVTFDGIAPFTSGSGPSSYDLSTPNSAYFSRADDMVNLAANNNLVVFLDPMETVDGCKRSKPREYQGVQLRGVPGFTLSWDNNLVKQVMAGVASTDPNHLQTIELNYLESYYWQDSALGSLLNLNPVSCDIGEVPGPLPRLRLGLDFIPSSDPQHPGLLIRDPLKFSDAMLLIPPQLVECLGCFDGEQTSLDLRSNLVRITGEIQIGELEKHLVDTLSQAGFLEDEQFEVQRLARVNEFVAAPKREASHAGSAYPDNAEEARKTVSEFMQAASRNGTPAGTEDSEDSLIGIAAPHVSPFGGWESYRDAYSALHPSHQDRTFVVLGTSHYGEQNRFGLTRKNFVTPFGETITDVRLVDELAQAAPDSVRMEDYCHAIEHSIEFQVLFLQYLYGPNIRILPILCGSFLRSIYQGGKPEGNEQVRRFFDGLGNLSAREGNKLLWVLGVDMAHMGRRYGDQMIARADEGEMAAVAERDKLRIERLAQSDAPGFWDLVQENQDDLKWCGSAPIYTFLKVVPQARGTLRRYQQWNIDEQSVVSFAAIAFRG